MDSRVIIVGGIPGTGKTTIAEALSSELGVTLLSKDILEAAIVRTGIATRDTLKGVGYELLSAMAINELSLGRSVILDCVAPLSRVNEFWADLLSEEIRYIECICSNNQLHESRISSRVRSISGWYELTWNDISNI